jgi:hypothetical protein
MEKENKNREREDGGKEMSVKRWLNRIHDPERREKALANARKDGVLEERTRFLSRAVNLFIWDGTPEGENYWADYCARQQMREEGLTDEQIEEQMNPKIVEDTPKEVKKKFEDQKETEEGRVFTSLKGKTVTEWITEYRPQSIMEAIEGVHEKTLRHLRHENHDKLVHDFKTAIKYAFPFEWTPEGMMYWESWYYKYERATNDEWEIFKKTKLSVDEEPKPEPEAPEPATNEAAKSAG